MGDKAAVKAFQICIRYLTPRARSIKEVRQHLMKKNFDEGTIENTIEKLKNNNLLNDRDFASAFVESRQRFKPKSKFALSWELKQKGIESSIIKDVLKDSDDEASAWAAVQAKLSLWQHIEGESFKKKVMNHLKNRGFGYDVSMRAYKMACRQKQR